MNSFIYSIFISIAVKMTVITSFILIIKLIFKNKLSAKINSLIWIIPCIQLIFCFFGISIESKSSIYNIINYTAVPAVNTNVSIKTLISFIWIIGVIFLFMWYLSVCIIYIKNIYCSERIYSYEIEECKKIFNIEKNVKVYRGTTAQTIGSYIILPYGFSKEEEKQILIHEMCHLKSNDYIKLWCGLIVVCINWFNPLIWYAFLRFRTDIEMLCDENVLFVTKNKKEYAYVLVKAAMEKNKFIPGAASVCNGKKEIKSRVKNIIKNRRKKPIWTAAALCTCTAVLCLCLTNAVTKAVEIKTDIISTPQPQKISEIISSYDLGTPLPAEIPEKDVYSENLSNKKEDISENESELSDKIENSKKEYNSEQKISEAKINNYNADTNDLNSSDSLDNRKDEQLSEINDESLNSENKDITDIKIGSEREEVINAAGNADESSAGGSKEIYNLDDGRTAILQYDGDILENGYIINK